MKVMVEDPLFEKHTTKISKVMKALLLNSQLYGQAADWCYNLTKKKLKSNDGVSLIVNKIYQRVEMSVVW